MNKKQKYTTPKLLEMKKKCEEDLNNLEDDLKLLKDAMKDAEARFISRLREFIATNKKETKKTNKIISIINIILERRSKKQ